MTVMSDTSSPSGTVDGLLSGKVVLITGAGGGIGREIALAAASEGARVMVNDLGAAVDGHGHDPAPAETTVALIRAAGGKAVADFGSVADPEHAQRMVDSCIAAFGRIDVVVNNAGNFSTAAIDEIDAENFDAILKVHLYGSFFVSRAAAAHFRTQRSGVFLHTTSSAGLIGNRGALAYSTAKGGIVALSRSIALDMAECGVRSNCIAPSAASRMSTVSRTSSGLAPVSAGLAGAAQVAPAAVFLVSDLAATLTGQIVGVRGNEVFLYNQPRPVRSLHRSDGWTARQLGAMVPAAWGQSLVPLEDFREVFNWAPL